MFVVLCSRKGVKKRSVTGKSNGGDHKLLLFSALNNEWCRLITWPTAETLGAKGKVTITY